MKLAILLVVGVIVKVYGDEPEAIVGGDNASPGQFPHQISLQYKGSHICGGSIISPTHIVTAAHCVANSRDHPHLTVVTGTQWSTGRDGQRHQIKCIQSNPEYIHNWPIINNDIAVITLTQPISFNSRQKSIPLASSDYSNGGSRAIVSGWGKTYVHSDVSDILKFVGVNVINVSECQKVHGRTKISRNQVCTYEAKGKGACHGDSGGPLICNGELIGVVSWGRPCAVGEPDVFTNVHTYQKFIAQCQARCP